MIKSQRDITDEEQHTMEICHIIKLKLFSSANKTVYYHLVREDYWAEYNVQTTEQNAASGFCKENSYMAKVTY